MQIERVNKSGERLQICERRKKGENDKTNKFSDQKHIVWLRCQLTDVCVPTSLHQLCLVGFML